ncbi:MAG: T9SS type A sorting domain-containing protein, partial [Cyclobacteriaceae bacterium]|nr:T9SS type A sorting domain-containing protein [Cyclobacteriaceae bacterium]
AGLFILTKQDNSITSVTKLNGLSDTGISLIDYNTTTNTLLISYENGQIDLLKDNVISSIPDIKLSDIYSSKISHHMYEDGIYTYLSTDFGLLKIDTETQHILESFLNLSSTGDNLKVFASTIYNDSLFLATEAGLMAGSLADNLKDFSKWKRFEASSGINSESAMVLDLHQNKPITANATQGLLQYTNGNWAPLGALVGDYTSSINTENETLITASGNLYKLENSTLSQIQSNDIIKAVGAISDENNYWIADNQNGMVHIMDSQSESFYPNGPFFNNVVSLKSVRNKIFALPPSKSSNGLPLRNNTGYSVFEDGFWTNYNSTGYPQTQLIPEFLDITGVSSQKSGEVMLSSYGYGLLRWADNQFEIINDTNSPLINSSPPNKNVLIANINSNNGNLWVLNNNTPSSLHLLANDGSWQTYAPSNGVANAKEIISTAWGDQWIAINSFAGGGIIVFNQSNEEAILKSDGFGTIPSNTINQILLDKEDKIWIATTSGVVYYLSPFSIIEDPSQEAIVPIINSQLLFNNENVNCLAVDGGNRIWMGTNKGAWLFDNDGSVLIEHFTKENSPLLSDIVINISINDLSGEVFFNTDKGLISYRGSASITGTYETSKIFPNPVKPGFTGVITIEGVPSNSIVKITDSSGRLITTLEANGNTAVWDMYSSFSNEVGTGVYFVFVSNSDGSSTQFGKIAVVK